MSSLLVQDLTTELVQEFRFTLNTRYNIAAFYPYLYMHNAPAGNFLFEIIKDAVVIFSWDFNCQDIKDSLSTTEDYVHVFFPIIPTTPVFMEVGDFTARLSVVNSYTNNYGSFIGWIQQYVDTNNILDYEALQDIDYPLAMRIKVYKEGLLI